MRRLTWFSLPFGAGCLLCAYLLPQEVRPWTAAGALAAGLLAMLLRGRGGKLLPVAAVGFAVGVLWFSGYAGLYLTPAEKLEGLEDLAVLELADYPEETGYGARCEVRAPGLRGRAMYYGGYDLLGLEPGDRVTSVVKYYSAARLGGEDSSYYTAQGVFLRLYGDSIVEVEHRDSGSLRYLPQRAARWLKDAVNRLYGQRAAGLITALLTGERDGLDEQSYSDISEAGLMHITAVSGLHCGFLIGLLGVLVFRRQRLTAALAYPVLLFYAVMVGCTPSVVRSCVMVGLFLLAPLLGREGDAPTSLSAALLVILLANPFAAASVSLQFSFASVAGLLLFSGKIQAFFNARRPKLGRIGKNLWFFCTRTVAASLSVMLTTAPLNAAYFGGLPLIAPVGNLLVLWVAPALFACALAGTVACGMAPVLAPLAAVPEALARYVLWIAGMLAKVPGHSVVFTGPAVVMWLLLAYALLGLCAVSRERKRKYLVAIVLAAVCLMAAKALPRMVVQNDALTAVAVDVGQGASTLLHAGERTALVDCGNLTMPRRAGTAAADAMDTYGWKRLDYVVLTHYHTDHAGGLAALLARVEVGELLLPQLLDSEDQADLQREVLALAEEYGVAVRYVEEPLEAELGEARVTVYPPVAEGSANEEGLTVLCAVGEFELLITGDMNAAAEKKLAAAYALPDIEVLMAGHHGSKYSTSEELLEAVWPEVGIISVGENSFGHPTEEAMGRMAAAGMTLYRTDWQGNILIRVHPETGETNGG